MYVIILQRVLEPRGQHRGESSERGGRVGARTEPGPGGRLPLCHGHNDAATLIHSPGTLR